MAKKQTRKSVSLNRQFYDKLKARAEETGVPMSQIVEQAIKPVIFGAQ